MKALKNLKTEVKDGKVTITADIAEAIFDKNVQQTTILFITSENRQWPRHIQISGEAVFVGAFGNKFAILNSDLVAIAAAVEPKTSYPPIFKNNKSPDLTVDIYSELDPDFQWQVSPSLKVGEVDWKDVAGQTSKDFDRTQVKKGDFVRCVASSEAGTMYSNPVLIT